MTLNNPKAGPGWVSEYQVSALPYATASVVTSSAVTRVDFPYLTSFITVKNSSPSGSVVVGFTYSGTLGSNNFTLTPGNSFGADFRIKTLYLVASSGSVSYEVVAGLTTIEPKSFPTLTGALGAIPPNGTITGSFGYVGLG